MSFLVSVPLQRGTFIFFPTQRVKELNHFRLKYKTHKQRPIRDVVVQPFFCNIRRITI
jgi:hypothetical protein